MTISTWLWKRTSISLHLIGTVVYGFAIIVQEFLNERSDPRSTYIGDFKYMTYWNLLIQFVFSCLSLLADLFPKGRFTRKLGDFNDTFFFCAAIPFSLFVCVTFWILHLMDKDNVRNPNVHNRYPEWYTHVTHTMNGVMNVFELMITYHSTPDHGHAILVTITMYISYTTFMYMFGQLANIWIYPFLENFGWIKRLVFSVIGGINLLFYYVFCVNLNKYFWPQNRIQKFKQLMS